MMPTFDVVIVGGGIAGLTAAYELSVRAPELRYALFEEGGTRTATLRARTPARVAVLPADAIDREALETLASGRDRET